MNSVQQRCYAAIVATVLGQDLPRHVPEHDHLKHYGPNFSMMPPASNMLDENTEEGLAAVRDTVLANLKKITEAGT